MPLDPTRLRTMVAGWLNDTCTIRSPGVPAYDETEGVDTVTPGDIVYSGECRLEPTALSARVVMAGDTPVTLHVFDLTLPYDATGVKVNQVVTINDSNDPHLVDRVYTVVDVQGGTDAAYRRLVIEDTLTIDEGEAGS